VQKIISCLLTLFIFVISLHAQDSEIQQKAALLASFNNSSQQLRLYNGVEHTGYPGVKGDAYYLTREWKTGSVVYDGILYNDVPMLYDIYKDQVIVKHPNEVFIVGLISSKVKSFTIDGYHFRRLEAEGLPANMQPGFYQVLVDQPITVLARRTKWRREYITTVMEYEFMPRNQYFVLKDGVYSQIRSEGNLMQLFGSERAQVKQHLRKDGLRYKKMPEQTIVAAVLFYQSLKK
jgi:hypothetical protein